MNKDDIQKKVDRISTIYKDNREIPLRILTVVCIGCIVFFLSSNMIFKKEQATTTTELNKIMTLNNVEFSITKRQYNPDTGLIQINFKMTNKSVNKIRNYNFEVREKSDPANTIENQIIQIDDQNYILLTTVSKKWGAISISIEDKSYPDKKLKLYSDEHDIIENTELIKLDKIGYTIELCENNIEDIKAEIENLNSQIDEKNQEINVLENRNNHLEDEKKYQVDSEKLASDGEIISNNNTINNAKNLITKLQKNIDEDNEKIDKLNEKIDNLQESEE